MKSLVSFEIEDNIAIVAITRPEVRNAVNRETAEALADMFRRFENDDSFRVAILTGAGGCFCAGADLNAVAHGNGNRVAADGDGPLGCTRMMLSKPVIAAVEGFAVAGGLELALWCDMRVAACDAVFGVYCRRFGVPLVDGGTAATRHEPCARLDSHRARSCRRRSAQDGSRQPACRAGKSSGGG